MIHFFVVFMHKILVEFRRLYLANLLDAVFDAGGVLLDLLDFFFLVFSAHVPVRIFSDI